MLQRLPEKVNFVKQVEYQACIEGSWPIAKLERLKELLSEGSGERSGDLTAKLEFGRHAGFLSLSGKLEANLSLVCQRCMQDMDYQISTKFLLGIVHNDEEADELPEDMEPCLLAEEEQSIIELLEDELLLSLPIAPTHEQDCSSYLVQQDERRQAEKMASSPFAALKDLKLD